MKNQLSGRFISFMGAGVRPLVFLSSFKSTEGPHCCFVSKPLDLYLAVCIRDISSKNATSDGGFCVGYTKDGPRFAATSVKQTHAQRHGGGLQCLWNTSLQHVYAYITFFFFFFPLPQMWVQLLFGLCNSPSSIVVLLCGRAPFAW